MFGGKKGKAIEQELQTAQQELQQRTQIIDQVVEKKDTAEEQFARMTASRAQMDTDLSQVVTHVKFVKEASENNQKSMDALKDNFKEAVSILEASNKRQNQFCDQVVAQRDKIQEVVESNKHFTTPAKYLSEYVVSNKTSQEAMAQNVKNMQEYAKNMSVLSLNAAIEAGRLGDSGRKFIDAAEEIRSFSNQYEQEASLIASQLKAAEEKNKELDEQIKHLTGLLRENNIAMGHLMKETMVCIDDYKRDEKHLKAAFLQDALAEAEVFMNQEKEIVNRQERILLQMEDIGDEFMEQKECSDELENICKDVMNSVTIGNVGNYN